MIRGSVHRSDALIPAFTLDSGGRLFTSGDYWSNAWLEHLSLWLNASQCGFWLQTSDLLDLVRMIRGSVHRSDALIPAFTLDSGGRLFTSGDYWSH